VRPTFEALAVSVVTGFFGAAMWVSLALHGGPVPIPIDKKEGL
jgi:hypothetical protein